MIRRQIVMPVTPERLWKALTDPDEMAGWFGARVEWDLLEGGLARFLDEDGRQRAGRVEAVRPGRHLRFRWWPASGAGPEATGEVSEVSEVSYVLEPVAEGTRLTIQERQVGPPAAGDGPKASLAGSPVAWTAWDGRLAGAWIGLVAPAFEGVRA